MEQTIGKKITQIDQIISETKNKQNLIDQIYSEVANIKEDLIVEKKQVLELKNKVEEKLTELNSINVETLKKTKWQKINNFHQSADNSFQEINDLRKNGTALLDEIAIDIQKAKRNVIDMINEVADLSTQATGLLEQIRQQKLQSVQIVTETKKHEQQSNQTINQIQEMVQQAEELVLLIVRKMNEKIMK